MLSRGVTRTWALQWWRWYSSHQHPTLVLRVSTQFSRTLCGSNKCAGSRCRISPRCPPQRRRPRVPKQRFRVLHASTPFGLLPCHRNRYAAVISRIFPLCLPCHMQCGAAGLEASDGSCDDVIKSSAGRQLTPTCKIGMGGSLLVPVLLLV